MSIISFRSQQFNFKACLRTLQLMLSCTGTGESLKKHALQKNNYVKQSFTTDQYKYVFHVY